MSTALITGASSGIGEGFARRLATIGYDVVLVARDVDRLTKLSAELRESWRVEVEVLPADLATDDGCRDVENRVADASNPIDMVINNAGFGLGISVVASDIEAEERMLRVMVRAPMRITKAALPGMLERGRGDLIIVASTAGLVSHNSYGATKAWGIRFSQALSVKLTGTGVRAVALCPGLTRTEFQQRGNIATGRVPGWMWLDVDRVVDDCLRDLQRGKTISVPSKRYKIIVAIGKLLPTSVVSKVTGLRRSAPVGATSVR
jgi:short-subunit dehydrogenase